MGIRELAADFVAKSAAREQIDEAQVALKLAGRRVKVAQGDVAELEKTVASGKGFLRRKNADAAAEAERQLGPARSELADAEAAVRAAKEQLKTSEAQAKGFELARAQLFSELDRIQSRLTSARHPAAEQAQSLLDLRERLVAQVDRTSKAIVDRAAVAESLELAIDHSRDARVVKAMSGSRHDAAEAANTAIAHINGAAAAVDSMLRDLDGLDVSVLDMQSDELVDARSRARNAYDLWSASSGVAKLAMAMREPVAELATVLPAFKRALVDEVKHLDGERVTLLLEASADQ